MRVRAYRAWYEAVRGEEPLHSFVENRLDEFQPGYANDAFQVYLPKNAVASSRKAESPRYENVGVHLERKTQIHACSNLRWVVPTFKERNNIQPLLTGWRQPLKEIEYEVIFVDDDSPDQTAAFRSSYRSKPIHACASCSASTGAVFRRPASWG